MMTMLTTFFLFVQYQVFRKKKDSWFPFKGNPRYIFGPSPFFTTICASKFFNNFRTNIDVHNLCFLEIDILFRESFEVFIISIMFFLWKRHLSSQKRGLYHLRTEGG